MGELEAARISPGDRPLAVVEQGVVPATQQDQVVGVGFAEVFDPAGDVVGVAPCGLRLHDGNPQRRSRTMRACRCGSVALTSFEAAGSVIAAR